MHPHSKGHHQHNEKATYRMGDNVSDSIFNVFISKICRDLNRKKSNLILKWAEESKGHFSVEDIHMVKRYLHEQVFNITNHQESVKTMRLHLPSVSIAVIEKTRGNSIDKDTEKREPFCTVVKLA